MFSSQFALWSLLIENIHTGISVRRKGVMTLMGKVELSSDALVQEVNGESVILDLKSEQYFSLNEVGTRAWQILVEDPYMEAVLSALLEEFDIDGETLQKDLSTLLDSLVDAELVKLIDEPVD